LFLIINYFAKLNKKNFIWFICYCIGDWGIGDWGLGIVVWGLGRIPDPQSPIPNHQSPIPIL